MDNHIIGTEIRWLESVGSTNEEMNRLLRAGKDLVEGLVIVARTQSAGRGMGDNIWHSQAGKNLTFSFFIRPGFLESGMQFYINVFVSLGLHAFLSDTLPDSDVCIKWPNDLYVEGRKIGGILINHAISGNSIVHSVIGIGLNVNQMQFPGGIPDPVSLKRISGKSYRLAPVLDSMIGFLNRAYRDIRSCSYDESKARYLDVLYGYQEWRRYRMDHRNFIARITGVSEEGLLYLEDKSGKGIEAAYKTIEFLE